MNVSMEQMSVREKGTPSQIDSEKERLEGF